MPDHFLVYDRQRWNALRRGIAFELTFAQWLEIWEQSGQLENRGRRSGQYVMSRNGDQGPYAVGNVSIKTTGRNLAESCERINRAGKSKPGEGGGVYLINPGLSKPYIARRGRHLIGHYATQAEGDAARAAFDASTPRRAPSPRPQPAITSPALTGMEGR